MQFFLQHSQHHLESWKIRVLNQQPWSVLQSLEQAVLVSARTYTHSMTTCHTQNHSITLTHTHTHTHTHNLSLTQCVFPSLTRAHTHAQVMMGAEASVTLDSKQQAFYCLYRYLDIAAQATPTPCGCPSFLPTFCNRWRSDCWKTLSTRICAIACTVARTLACVNVCKTSKQVWSTSA